MNIETEPLSNGFQWLCCDASVFEVFSKLHPIGSSRVRPLQSQDPVVDDARLIDAEEAHRADPNDQTRPDPVAAYCQCGLLPEADAGYLNSVLEPEADFVRERIKTLP